MENRYVRATWCFYYIWYICNWLSNDVFYLGYIIICNWLIVAFFIINITYIYISIVVAVCFLSLCLFENDCCVKAISLLCLIVFLCLFGLGFFLLKYPSCIVSWILKNFRINISVPHLICIISCIWAS